ncbi:DNA-3-methyladenine glycosylase [Capsulimonas corticalis]|uniref:DNA-3-methyladenine glycosylase I n=1 Tax=Capsulimonas corticalis TaxID=2219043 RepID=A0A402CWN1_9BACT|nr:DNA-3-methyladenine glycosylase I [Capsulimonas corticalis]BDI34207.1 DNA-3-methyladenine glycosylase [Capsulimonas corticalis]
MTEETIRCSWAVSSEMIEYHDTEWGVPSHDDTHLFEMLTLEGAQAGLSWATILRRRQGYRAAFANFDVSKVAAFDDARIEEIVLDPGVIRHRGKIAATVGNAKAFLSVQQEFGSFDAFLWRFVDGAPITNHYASPSELPAKTPVSDALSKALMKRGFKFVGSTICYAYMQAVGMVDDHMDDCVCRTAKKSAHGV